MDIHTIQFCTGIPYHSGYPKSQMHVQRNHVTSRSALKDDTVANILRTHEIEDLVGDLRVPFSRMYNLRSDALSDRIDWSR